MFEIVSEKLISIFEDIIQFIFKSLIEPFLGLSQLKDLVFGRAKDGELVWGSFYPSDLTDALNPLFYSMTVLAGFVIVAMIVISGIRVSGAPLNPSRRNEMLEFFKDLLIVGIVLVNLPTIYDLLFSINQGVVGMFSGAYESNLDSLQEERSEVESGVIGYIFIQLILLGLSLWANFYYLMRKVTLLILMGMGPLMMAFWMHPQFKSLTGAWFRELIGSIFVQAIHAFVFWTVAVISAASNGFVETVIVYLIFIPISESVRRLLNMGGDMQGGLAKAGSMLGMAGLAGMYGSIKGALDGKSVMGVLREGYNGIKNGKGATASSTSGNDELKSTLGANAGSDDGSTPVSEKMLKAGDIMGRAGKAVFGMAGSVAGSPLGPVGAMAGATGGLAAGGVIGGVVGRAGMAGLQGLATRHKKGKEALESLPLKNNKGFEENFANEVADRETASWADENRQSIIAGLRERFPDATDKELDSHFNQIKENKRAGFYQDAKSKFTQAKSKDGTRVSGNQLVAASSEAMANRWADENQAAFFANYEKEYPQKEGESSSDFAGRRMNAFKSKKAEMKNAFAEAGDRIVSANAIDGNEPIDKNTFTAQLGNAVQKIPGIQNTRSLIDVGNSAISNLKGKNVISGNQLVATSAEAMANKWADENQASFFANYDRENPQMAGESQTAYADRRMQAFNNKKGEIKNAFAEAGQRIVSANSFGEGLVDRDVFERELGTAVQNVPGVQNTGSLVAAGTSAISKLKGQNLTSGNQLVSVTSEAMANKWADENQSAFFTNYDRTNPQMPGESQTDYTTRRMAAFNNKKGEMRNAFAQAGQRIVSVNAIDSNGTIDKNVFARQLEDTVQSIPGISSAQSIISAGGQAVSHIQGENVLLGSGKPNSLYLSCQMASAKTAQMKQQFINEQVANGIDKPVAQQMWTERLPQVHAENLAMYRQSADIASNQLLSNGWGGVAHSVSQAGEAAVRYSMGASGITGAIQTGRVFSNAIREGTDAAQSSFVVATDHGQAGIVQHIKGVQHAATSGFSGAMNYVVDQAGGAVEAQSKYQNTTGYVAGMLFGAKGYQVGKSIAYRFSPIQQQVQKEIYSPSEVIQMAKTTTDDYGNTLIAPGAIRQVITPNESYIEVQTKSGEIQTVSRKGAGHSGLRRGDVVYQDLAVQGDSLVVSAPKGLDSTTYRLDSGGGRVASSIKVESNPNELLGSPRISSQHRAQQLVQVPMYSQSVDSGQFYIDDLRSQGLQNVQVVIEKDRQFVTAQKEGMTYRVSPIFAGDTKLDSNQTVQIPVTVKNNKLVPNSTTNSNVAVQSHVETINGIYEPVNKADTPYYSSKPVESLMISRQALRAQRGLDKRKALDEVRRKQGLLG